MIKIQLAFHNTEYCKNYIILRKKGFPLHIDSCIDDETLLWNHQEFKLLASITLWKLFSNLNSYNLANIEIFKHCHSKIIEPLNYAGNDTLFHKTCTKNKTWTIVSINNQHWDKYSCINFAQLMSEVSITAEWRKGV